MGMVLRLAAAAVDHECVGSVRRSEEFPHIAIGGGQPKLAPRGAMIRIDNWSDSDQKRALVNPGPNLN